MPKNIDSISDDTWIDLCSKYCLAEICRQVSSYREAVIPKLTALGISAQPYDATKAKHSAETVEKRRQSLIKYHQDNPNARQLQTDAISKISENRKGKTLEEYYGNELGKLKRENVKKGHSYRLNKTYNEIFGEDRAKEISKKRSKSSLGRIHTPEAIEKMSQTRKDKMLSGEIRLSPRVGCGLGGYRDDIGHYVRSSFEHYFAKELKRRNIEYKYEPEVFKIMVDHINTTYTPDFLIDSTYIEIKNSYNVTDEKFKKRLAAFNEQYPEKKIIVVVGSRVETEYINIVEKLLGEMK